MAREVPQPGSSSVSRVTASGCPLPSDRALLPSFMEYHESPPPPSASAFLECLWMAAGEPTEGEPDPIVPDGCAEIILHRRGWFHQFTATGTLLQPQAFVVGVTTQPMRVVSRGRWETWGIRFRPGGLHALLGLRASLACDRTIPLEEVVGPGSRSFFDRFQNARSRAEAAQMLRAFIESLSCDHRDETMTRLSRHTLRTEPPLDVTAMAHLVGISRRQLERRFDEKIGVSPKMFLRIARFQRALALVQESSMDHAAIAAATGFFDQSHMISDFRRFSGTTPTRWTNNEAELASQFTRPERLAGMIG